MEKVSKTDNSLMSFKAISNFTSALNDLFGKKQHSLRLYSHLINKTTISHEKPIAKHHSAFRKFCIDNREAIRKKNPKAIKNGLINYSTKVFINVEEILRMADKDTEDVIWQHLRFISAIVDPAGKAKELLMKESVGKEETDFLSEVISKVEKHVDPNANPMEAVSKIMQSGIFTDLVQGMNDGMKDGSLDLGKLVGSVQKLVGSQEGAENMPDLSKMMGPLLSSLNNAGKDGEAPPDLSQMMGPLLGAMGGGGGMENNPLAALLQPPSGGGGSIEENIQKQVEKAKREGKL